MAAPMSRASAPLLMPATMSPAMMSRMALVMAMPGTSAMRAPMMIRSRCAPRPAAVSSTAATADAAAPAMVLKNWLAPKRAIRAEHRPMTTPHSPPHIPSRHVPP